MMRRIHPGIRNRLKKLWASPYQRSYSQSGEDLILQSVLAAMGIANPRYLDVGANDPIKLSNTYLFYRHGASGVLVEPNPTLARRLVKVRPRDMVRACGVGPEEVPEAQLFVLSAHTASTFSKREADLVCQTDGISLVDTVAVEIKTLETIVREEFAGNSPDLLSLDVEGWDEAIVANTDWRKIRPAVICVETREYAEEWSGRRLGSISGRLQDAGYGLAGLTFYNSIFADLSKMREP